ncbi:MAG: hypothetical protein IT323_14780 [Anaerolineae bacterium]|nr:hypothetical protein [Anaerolineae bacterium]
MAEIVQIELSEDVARRARDVARQTGRRFEDVLRTWINQAAQNTPVDSLPDDQVLALADAMMNEAEQTELSRLLHDQREGLLDKRGKARLEKLFKVYQETLIRKSEALRVAVARGLRPPLG